MIGMCGCVGIRWIYHPMPGIRKDCPDCLVDIVYVGDEE
jgi:hypothetical protein